ncbi:hypothetical protein FQN60_005389 [Etheostoma spectabile]|uniref:Uncharacterized protein n=1 Tax=Etheostoma spectabile TaxID=54343 RepID=A0A5J5CB42_9PERO|nr:hypothetical protein FQN60_005389 [Etheostoma spectabile]
MLVCLFRNTNLSLLDSSGAMVSIDPTMPHNTESSTEDTECASPGEDDA